MEPSHEDYFQKQQNQETNQHRQVQQSQYKAYPENLEPMTILSNQPVQIELIERQEKNFLAQYGSHHGNLHEYRSTSSTGRRGSEMEEDQNQEKYVLQLTTVSHLPVRIYVVVVALILGGACFLVWGFLNLFLINEFESGLGFTILGSLMSITGIFYLLKIISYRVAKTPEEKQRAINEFPLD